MLTPHLNSLQGQIAVVLPRPRGGVAPPRHEVALADYIRKQESYRQSKPRLINACAGTVLSTWILRACLAAAPMLRNSKRAAARVTRVEQS
jgi:hypothetical protein